MDTRDVQKYYEPTKTPTFYVGQVSNVLGRVPLMPLFLLGNATPTIPYKLRKYQRNRFPYGRTNTAQESCRRGSNVYELNAWLWQFWRGKPRVGVCLSLMQRIGRRGPGVAMPRGPKESTT
jgi:hypothetical protein